MLRRDLHGVCGVAGDVARDGAREVDVLRQLVQVGLDLADRWQRLVPRARALGVGTGRDRALVDGVGAGVVDPEVATRDHRLSVAVVGLELQSELVRAGREPHATRAALQQRVGALNVGGSDEVIGEGDAGADSRHRRRAERRVHGVSQLLWPRNGTAARGRHRDRGSARNSDDDSGEGCQKSLGRSCPKEPHHDRLSCERPQDRNGSLKLL